MAELVSDERRRSGAAGVVVPLPTGAFSGAQTASALKFNG